MKNTIIDDFLTYLEVEKNRSPKTIENYRFYLSRFFNWTSKHAGITKISPQNINLPIIRKYRIYLNRLETPDGRLLKKNTQNYHLIAIRSFLKFLSKSDIKSLAPEHIELGKMPERQVNFLDKEEVSRLLDSPLKDMAENPKLGDLRDKAILEILFSSGLRVSELVKLKRSDINLKRKRDGVIEFTVLGKGKRTRLVFLSERAAYWLGQYLTRRMDVSPWMFTRMDRARGAFSDEAPMTERSVQRLVEKYSALAGIAKKVSPHTLRHSFATDLLSNNADIRSVQEMLGHSSITTTQVYTHITDKHLRESFKKYHNRKSNG